MFLTTIEFSSSSLLSQLFVLLCSQKENINEWERGFNPIRLKPYAPLAGERDKADGHCHPTNNNNKSWQSSFSLLFDYRVWREFLVRLSPFHPRLNHNATHIHTHKLRIMKVVSLTRVSEGFQTLAIIPTAEHRPTGIWSNFVKKMNIFIGASCFH